MKISISNPEAVVCFLDDYIEERFFKYFFKALKETIDGIFNSTIEKIEELSEDDCIFLYFLPIYLSAINDVKLTDKEILNMIKTGFKIDNIDFIKSEFLSCIKPYIQTLEEAENIYKTNIISRNFTVDKACLSNVIYKLHM